MSAWKTFYEGREGHEYLEYVKQRYAPFISAIRARVAYNDLILELGSGTGTITKALCVTTGRRCTYAATDYDPEMVKLTKERLTHNDVSVYVEDALHNLHPTKAEVVHSMGMLEHFEDFAIQKIIDNYRHARVQVHYVPGLYDAPTFGDERLMSVDEWWRICKPDQIITFNGGLDYALIFER
jgi:SAM-dependent methyltransferase